MRDHRAIETERLVLRPLEPNHAAGLHGIYSDPQAMRFWSEPLSRALEETKAMIARLNAGSARSWVLTERGRPEAIGHIYYLGNEGPAGLGYILHPYHWKKGYMSEAVRGVLGVCFNEIGLDRIELWIDARNIASQNLAERNGFKRRSAFVQAFAHAGAPHETLVYGLTAEEWRSVGRVQALPSAQVYGLIPVLAVPDVQATADFYRDRLGFQVLFLAGDPPVYGAVALREWTATGATIRFSRAKTPRQSTDVSLYLQVGAGLDDLFDIFRALGVEVVESPHILPWGVREFAIRDCNGYVLRFGMPVPVPPRA